ncbi:putative CheY-like fused with Metal-dependent phosphohydrolase [Vibrio nigripulchritudo MADA3029]|uniref:CheY-like fused with Metal-dependent phosphohydrolase n=1 Tax=Vibrio nigripulchritudo SOn1 TaxID=1238450 RepID=A0AAV2VY08_9VIBR|nr:MULTISPECIES: two-component system response regulator [Vibrio]EGU54504.1 response regulator [Vibrio nigripulchritudo ATCC 27043]KJY76852.1 chemotaxis protein CheY [Vibrio nigripulchritudo]UAB71992.1 two-component system response regulator [Vibrio sp. SCSIO 43132]CCN37056.1 putative CheY-like fused with Metal-dependent phosphohydrolase [Vibrio nigripulchritudo AM115]CCN42114.1 putative CheY-like fused with Metal-dependent phosphohydrolase [Vibrio nigripulchritudo FTn2]
MLFKQGDKKTILIVDDTAENRTLITGLLKDDYRVLAAVSGMQALELCERFNPDMVLLDIMMPVMDGYEVCYKLKKNPKTESIPVIFLTAKSQIEDEQKGFDVGAVDYILKPISPPILLARVQTHLKLKFAMESLKEHNDVLEQRVKERTEELELLQDATILAMASLAETRDNDTGNHIRRTQKYVKILAETMAESPKYASKLDSETIEALYKSAPLHDIGKVGIPDNILLKPGKLTDEEFDIMKGHSKLGGDTIDAVEKTLGVTCAFLQHAKDIAYYHQEKWDGSGYPDHLVGEDIPLSARLMAVADVYDALISSRCYKPPFPHSKAVEIIESSSGSHFDPDVVEAFRRVEQTFDEIAHRFADEPEERSEKQN